MSHNELAATVQSLNQRLINMTIAAICFGIVILMMVASDFYQSIDPQVIKSPHELTPSIELTTDGATIYVYTSTHE